MSYTCCDKILGFSRIENMCRSGYLKSSLTSKPKGNLNENKVELKKRNKDKNF